MAPSAAAAAAGARHAHYVQNHTITICLYILRGSPGGATS